MKTEIIGLQSRRVAEKETTGQRNDADSARIYSKVVERYAIFFDRPEIRLRFLSNALAKQLERQEELKKSLHHLRFIENTWFYDWVFEARLYGALLDELRALAPTLPKNRQHLVKNIQLPMSARVFSVFYHVRHAFYAMVLVVTGLGLFGLYSFGSWSARQVNSYFKQKYENKRPIVVKEIPPTTTPGEGQVLAGYQAERIWRVSKNKEYEYWSNGARIFTQYETENRLRGYNLIPRGSDTLGNQLHQEPIGIVYHTSESDIVPFNPDNNLSIQQRSLWLLQYVQKHKSYNYIIDRYGNIYRIVRDDHAANHAGYSIWSDDKYTYVGLNESFIGICFESTSTAGSLEETLTGAQLRSGIALTQMLRSEYHIEDINCTTHGLVSVNPENMLIAFHHDWVRNFPFAAMGLTDKYKIPPPGMSDYGFTFDEDVLKKLGNQLWPGAIAADEEFRKRAERSGVNPDALRRRLRELYERQYERARKLRGPLDENGKSSIAKRSDARGSFAESGKN